MPDIIPGVDKCCFCIRDLKTAVAIIAVLGIVTSPAVSWSIVRHSYVIRVSCFIAAKENRADVIDINLNNILSFGFGANAGLGPSCLGPKKQEATSPPPSPPPRPPSVYSFRTTNATNTTDTTKGRTCSVFLNTVRWVGWIVLTADIIFVACSIYFLIKIFRPPEYKAAKYFIISCIVAISISFIYGMLYVAACISVGGSFPIFEFFFCIVDLIMWIYFLIVVNTYAHKILMRS